MEKQSGDGRGSSTNTAVMISPQIWQDTKGDTVVMPDTVVFFCTEVLCCKSI